MKKNHPNLTAYEIIRRLSTHWATRLVHVENGKTVINWRF